MWKSKKLTSEASADEDWEVPHVIGSTEVFDLYNTWESLAKWLLETGTSYADEPFFARLEPAVVEIQTSYPQQNSSEIAPIFLY